MLQIDSQNNITLTRGDSLTLTVSMTKDNQTYTPTEGDSLRFALSKGYKGQPQYALKLEKDIDISTLTFTLGSTETQLPYDTFNYDVELTYQDGNVDTFISGLFTITGECE